MKKIFVSDIHVGDERSQYKKLIQMIESEKPDELFLVGDILDLQKSSFKKIYKKYQDFLVFLYKFSLERDVNYIIGNHDERIEKQSFLFNKFLFSDEIDLEFGRKKIKVIHGHQFDNLIINYFPLSKFLDRIYRFLLKFNIYFEKLKFSLVKKENTTIFKKAVDDLKKGMLKKYKKYEVLITGHTHIFENSKHDDLRYINLGDWIFNNSYAIEEDGRFILLKYRGKKKYGNCF